MKNSGISIEIHAASESDAAEILEVQKQAFYRQGVLYDDFELPPLVQTLEELILDFKAHVFLKALYQGKIVGSVRGATIGMTCHISRLFVHPDHQNRGIGKKLMHAIEDRFSTARRYELYTGHRSEKSLVFYAKLGYREFQRKPQSDSVMLICMEKQRA